ncbi:MAG: hypothetical protein HUU02_05760 [Bacteroidetes bacterium]|nr:hypothetical protein [Bacteroidota bacterium]
MTNIKDISEIFYVRQDGTHLRQLTDDKQFVHYADFISNSSKILYVQSNVESGSQTLYTLDLLSGQKDSICTANIFQSTHSVDEPPYKRLHISSNGIDVYFASWNTNDAVLIPRDIYRVNILTKQITNLTKSESNYRINEFTVSSNESLIVFSKTEDPRRISSLDALDLASGVKTNLYHSPADNCLFPQWLQDGKRIFFIETDYAVGKARLLHTDSGNTLSTINVDPRVGTYFPKVFSNDKVILDRKDGSGLYVLFDLHSFSFSNLNIPGTAKPYPTQDESQVLFFNPQWSICSINVSDLSERKLILNPQNSGNTVLPQASRSNAEILFLSVQTIEVRR